MDATWNALHLAQCKQRHLHDALASPTRDWGCCLPPPFLFWNIYDFEELFVIIGMYDIVGPGLKFKIFLQQST